MSTQVTNDIQINISMHSLYYLEAERTISVLKSISFIHVILWSTSIHNSRFVSVSATHILHIYAASITLCIKMQELTLSVIYGLTTYQSYIMGNMGTTK